jgi:glycosyltransferase involved in cell wall biosynthesis
MLISGFSFARNADSLGYPVVESITSVLPVCDEFIIAVGKGDPDDTTRSIIAGINDPKIRIIDTEWNDIETLRSRIYSQQTNLALSRCSGTWCFYIQADEVIHERYLDAIRTACEHFTEHPAVDGFLFRYKHFWGDYDHYLVNHRWYPREIRILRNHSDIVSVGDAQSFRYGNGKKIPVVALDAEVFHYGHVRDPRKVAVRKKAVRRIYRGSSEETTQTLPASEPLFNYGSLEKLPFYRGIYPTVMEKRIAKMDWKHLLQYHGTSPVTLPHDRLKYRFLTFVEQKIFRGSGREFWGYKPYRILRRLSRDYSRTVHRSGATSQSPSEETLPDAAVVIAVYNHADFLEKVFHSLRNQTEQNFEIIVADDGSGDEIPAMISRYDGTFRWPIRHVRHDDNGFRKTVIVNRAVTEAKAGYCIFIDGDCILHHRFVEFHLRRGKPGTVLSGRRVMMNRELSDQVTLEDIASRRIENWGYWWGKCNRAGYRHGFFIPGMYHLKNLFKRKKHDILGSNFSVFKKDFLLINGYDERIIGRGMEDDNLSIRFSMAGIPVKTVSFEALQYHLHHSADPIPHDGKSYAMFRDAPAEARTPFGIVKTASLR